MRLATSWLNIESSYHIFKENQVAGLHSKASWTGNPGTEFSNRSAISPKPKLDDNFKGEEKKLYKSAKEESSAFHYKGQN